MGMSPLTRCASSGAIDIHQSIPHHAYDSVGTKPSDTTFVLSNPGVGNTQLPTITYLDAGNTLLFGPPVVQHGRCQPLKFAAPMLQTQVKLPKIAMMGI